MHVHVDGGRIEIEKQKGNRKLPFHERGVIPLAQRRGQHCVFNRAPVHEDKLLRPGLPAHARLPDQSANPDVTVPARLVHGEKPIDQLLAVEVANPIQQIRHRRQLKNDALIADKDERDFRMPRGLKMELVLDIPALGVLRTQKFPARRQIIKNGADLDLSAGSLPAVAHRFDLPARHDDFRSRNRLRFASAQPETRNARDTWQRFAAKPESGNRRQIGRRPDFTRGVSFQGKESVVAVHPATVVHYPHQRDPPAPDADLDLARSRVDAVFHELLDDRRRALDHLAGGHLAREDFRQQTDPAHDNFDFRLPIFDCEGKGGWFDYADPRDSFAQRMITVTDNAVRQLRSLLESRGATEQQGLRVGIAKGGCSGLSYEMSLGARKPGDEIVERDGVEFFVDAESADYLRGSTLDYRDGLTGAGFHIENPNAARTCGCGTSFEAARPA